MKTITRLVENYVVKSLASFPIVYIAGPRQSGKTTLAKHISSTRHKATYITFDDIQIRSAASRDPEAFLRNLEGPVILDEVQMVPEVFRPLKVIVDENRNKKNKGRGQFLLTGSANIMILPKLSDALVGRMVLHNLLPFSACEIDGKQKQNFITRAFTGKWHFRQINIDTKNNLTMLSYASFPELLTLKSYALKHEWCNSYLNTILQRDIRTLSEIDKVTSLPNMLRFLASRAGGVLNEAALSRTVELNHLTIKKYRILLESLFLILSIPAWSSNLGKRLVKSPKIYLSDLNLLSYLLNINFKDLPNQNSSLWGQVLENFVAIELNKQLAFSDLKTRIFHYRANSGQEVDFLLEGPDGKIVAIEVKAASKVLAKDFRHIEALQIDISDKFHLGFVVYQGKDIVPFGNNLFAIPMGCLW